MEINEILRSLREDRDLTQKEIADITGVTVKQVWRWEQGTSEMGIDKLKRLCEYYKVSADYILGLNKGLTWPREEDSRKTYNPTKYNILQSEKDPTKSIFLFSSGHPKCYAPRMSFIVTDNFYRRLPKIVTETR